MPEPAAPEQDQQQTGADDNTEQEQEQQQQQQGFTTLSAEDLSEEELNEFKEIFNLVDRDGGGSISNSELGDLMDTLGINATQEEIDLMINEIDQDSNGEIDFDEFVAVMSRKVNAMYTIDQVRGAFRVFEDKSRPGHILPAELEKTLNDHCSSVISKEQVHELVRQLEVDSHGFFHYQEYINLNLH
ncbi:Calmodulin (CaM) [Durusdinium trenchii]|uniref:Calmodulin n=1 Tax=Durusdinium trenchii TaxID=1381693 RepID=A0ABP0J9D3_9DINO